MTTTPLEVAVDPVHVGRLAELNFKTDRVRYACQHGPSPTTDEVCQWLAAYGYEMRRPYVSTLVTNYRATLGLDSTGELPALTDEVLADLDRRVSADVTADVQTPDGQGVQTPDVPVATPRKSVSTDGSNHVPPQMRTDSAALVDLAPVPAAESPVETAKPATVPLGRVAQGGMAVLLTVVGLLLAGVIVAPIALSSQDIIAWAAAPTGLGLKAPWPLVAFLALDAAAADPRRGARPHGRPRDRRRAHRALPGVPRDPPARVSARHSTRRGG